ncbi:MAG: hypothetical protein WC551_10690 [Patescibacteria group bacterium]|jgi:hypothetical protein
MPDQVAKILGAALQLMELPDLVLEGCTCDKCKVVRMLMQATGTECRELALEEWERIANRA